MIGENGEERVRWGDRSLTEKTLLNALEKESKPS